MLKKPEPFNTDYEQFFNALADARPDLQPNYIKSLLLDGDAYLKGNQDVLEAGLCPYYHFFTYGYKEKRFFNAPNFRAITRFGKVISDKRVFFFDTIKSNTSFLYRGFFPEIRNDNSSIIHQETALTDALVVLFSAKEVVFIRPSQTSSRTKYFINLCKKLSIKITLDYDDLLLPEYAYSMGSVRSGLTPFHSMAKYLHKDSAFFLQADEVICSTPIIAKAYEGLIGSKNISRNKLPKEYFADPDLVRGKNNAGGNKVKILYLSESPTNLTDYSLISGVLAKLAQKHSDRFSIFFMGNFLYQKSLFECMGVESSLVPFMSFEDVVKGVAKYDVVLVPLENSIVNTAKSNIKFIEAASQAVPVVASAIDEYTHCIDHGVNGWLCKTDHDWYRALEEIVLNRSAIAQAGIRAYDKALSEYSI